MPLRVGLDAAEGVVDVGGGEDAVDAAVGFDEEVFGGGGAAEGVEEVLAGQVGGEGEAVVDAAGWKAIDEAEVARGTAEGRPRDKFTTIADMLAAAATAPTPPVRQRLLAGLRR